jgi:hypothetical protein
MQTILLLAIAASLYLNLQELRAMRDDAEAERCVRESAQAALERLRLAERRITRLTDEAVLSMLDEVQGAEADYSGLDEPIA